MEYSEALNVYMFVEQLLSNFVLQNRSVTYELFGLREIKDFIAKEVWGTLHTVFSPWILIVHINILKVVKNTYCLPLFYPLLPNLLEEKSFS